MNIQMKVTGFLWLVFCLAQSLSAQQGIVSSGGDHFSQNGSVAYSVGQVMFEPINGETGNIYPGMQQPFQFGIVGISQIHAGYLYNIYPNPANQFLRLQLSTDENKINDQDLIARVYDVKGNLLISQKLVNPINTILISDLTEGLYFVQIVKTNTILQSISFSKIN